MRISCRWLTRAALFTSCVVVNIAPAAEASKLNTSIAAASQDIESFSLRAQSDVDRAACGGAIEKEVWNLWDARGRAWAMEQLLRERLERLGDSYALYDLEGTFHNLLAMAQRCDRRDRLRQFATDWGAVYRYLVPLRREKDESKSDPQKAIETSIPRVWICRGGNSCNDANRLKGTEVALVSAQGLGLLVHLANALATTEKAQTPAEFVDETAEVASEHLLRWADVLSQGRWEKATKARPEDVTDGSSRLFFSDQELWMVGIYAELAGILQARPKLRESFMTGSERDRNRQALLKLFNFFKARVSYQEINSTRLGKIKGADLDRGYRRLHADNRFAGYAESQKPAICSDQAEASPSLRKISPAETPIVPTLGLDLSHARRLVHVLDALDRNRAALKSVFLLNEEDLPPSELGRYFSATLVAKVWNGDIIRPTFSNYWDGTNGWYRVAYNNGMKRCVEGYPPSGLSDAYPTGGYAVWGRFYPVLRDIGLAIYVATTKEKDVDSAVRQYYPKLLSSAPANVQMTNRLMFWPSVVGIR